MHDSIPRGADESRDEWVAADEQVAMYTEWTGICNGLYQLPTGQDLQTLRRHISGLSGKECLNSRSG